MTLRSFILAVFSAVAIAGALAGTASANDVLTGQPSVFAHASRHVYQSEWERAARSEAQRACNRESRNSPAIVLHGRWTRLHQCMRGTAQGDPCYRSVNYPSMTWCEGSFLIHRLTRPDEILIYAATVHMHVDHWRWTWRLGGQPRHFRRVRVPVIAVERPVYWHRVAT